MTPIITQFNGSLDNSPSFNSLHASDEIVITFAKSLDPDEKPHNVTSHQDLNCWSLQRYFEKKFTKFNFL